ncbi:MAG: hypothetical protein LBT11_06230 [Treponema sp.]|nr:hypothetical protein [Treponema sp.]
MTAKGCTARLLSARDAKTLDAEAVSWGFDPFALVEAVGRACAHILAERFRDPLAGRVAVAAGSGNNGADALVTLRALILEGMIRPESAAAVLTRPSPPGERSPRARAVESLRALGVPVLVWGEAGSASALAGAALILDGIAGTGLEGPLRGNSLEMARAVRGSMLVSIDMPSGLFDGWKAGMPLVHAASTLAIEPLKAALYKPASRIAAGTIIPVGGIFPGTLAGRFEGPELVGWEAARERVAPVRSDAHKYGRGVVEIRAGSPGSAGAACIAASGAAAAGAGLVRLLVDESLYPVLGAAAIAGAPGVMVAVAGSPADDPERFRPDAILLGPGWGRGGERLVPLEQTLEQEARGIPVVLDADALALVKGRSFQGNAILTPHTGEFIAYTGIPQEDILADPPPFLLETARKVRGIILFKSHVIYVASPDGRLGILDGMAPVLASGGSGDLLSGFCAALAARQHAEGAPACDGYNCAIASAALLLETARRIGRRFAGPLELAGVAASVAGEVWL